MTTTDNDFRRLNALRSQLQMPPLKAWKESKAELQSTIDALQAKLAPKDTTQYFVNKDGEPVVPKVCPPSRELQALERRRKAINDVVEKRMNGVDVVAPPAPGSTAKLGDAAKVKRAPQPVTESTGSTIKLSEICKEIGMDPKIARAKLRRTMTPPNITVGKYVYRPEGKNIVITILRGGK